MRCRAGPLGVLLALTILAFVSMGCTSTRAKLGEVVGSAGELVSTTGSILTGIADVIVNGPADDVKSATDSLGLTEPDSKAAPATAPAPPPVPPPGPSGAIRGPDEEEDLTAPVAVERLREASLRPWYAAPRPSSFRPSTGPRQRC